MTIAIVVIVAAVIVVILSTLGDPPDRARKRPEWYDEDEDRR